MEPVGPVHSVVGDYRKRKAPGSAAGRQKESAETPQSCILEAPDPTAGGHCGGGGSGEGERGEREGGEIILKGCFHLLVFSPHVTPSLGSEVWLLR